MVVPVRGRCEPSRIDGSGTWTECDHNFLDVRCSSMADRNSFGGLLTEVSLISPYLRFGIILRLCLHFPRNCLPDGRPLETVGLTKHDHHTCTAAGEWYRDSSFRPSCLTGSSPEPIRYGNREPFGIVNVTLGNDSP